MWSEAITGKGSNEVASCTFDFIKQNVKEGKKIVFLTSDNCGGQNKNKGMATMMWHAIRTLDIDLIEHGFLEKGHTQNENDSVHSTISTAAKKTHLHT